MGTFIRKQPLRQLMSSKVASIENKRKEPPLWLLIIVFFILFSLISVGITFVALPWYIPVPRSLALPTGITLLVLGFFFLISAFRKLEMKRVFGKEIYKPEKESTLIITGIYSHTRNPLYLGSALLFLGWVFIFLLTFLLVMTFLFIVLFYFVARWEEKELTERFGEEYIKYKKTVPFFIPHLKFKRN